MRKIIITQVSGATYPINVFISDIYGNNKNFLGVIDNPVPPEVDFTTEIPSIFDTAPQIMLTMVDSQNIEYFRILNCSDIIPTPTPTLTQTPGYTPPPPSPSQTPTLTVSTTSTPTPTPTLTPTLAPTFYAYIFAEPQNSVKDLELLSFANMSNSDSWYSWYGNGVPNNNSGNYSNDLNIYAHQPNFIYGNELYIKPQNLSSQIAQYQGQIINGISQNLHTFGSIEIKLSGEQRNTLYYYSIWIPLDGVGGSISAITIDVGTSLGEAEVYDALPAMSSTLSYDVNVTSGASIPEGVYRVIWISPQMQLPAILPLNATLFIRGDSKF